MGRISSSSQSCSQDQACPLLPKVLQISRMSKGGNISPKIPNIDAEISLLIGSDTPEIHEPKQVIPSQNGGPYATRTTLGWVVIGKLGKVMNANTRTANFIKADLRLNGQFQSYCDMEFNDSACTEAKSMSANDKHAMRLMSDSIKLENGHYQLALPWRNHPPCLENNRSVVGHRLRLLKRRLSRDPELKSKYKDCMEDLMKRRDMQRKLSQPNWKGQDMVPPPPPCPTSSKTWKCMCCVGLLRQVPRQVPQ